MATMVVGALQLGFVNSGSGALEHSYYDSSGQHLNSNGVIMTLITQRAESQGMSRSEITQCKWGARSGQDKIEQ